MPSYAFLGDTPFQTDPHDVTWDFRMKVREQKTLGGKVVQVLGTTLGDLTVTGKFGYGPVSEGRQNWQDQIRFRNRIIRQVRANEQQRIPKPMRFRYTPRGWDFLVFVKHMTETRFTNQDIAPQWTLVFSIDEEGSGDIVRGITDLYLNRLMDGVGWKQTDYNGPTDDYVQGVLAGGTVGDYLSRLAQEAFDSGLPGGQIGAVPGDRGGN